MALPIFFGILTLFGAVFALTIYRAGRNQWDNRVFATMALIDALTNAYRAARLLGGGSLIDLEIMLGCTIASFPMAIATVEFAYSFPFNRPAPPKVRVPVLVLSVIAFVLGIPGFREQHEGWQAIYYSGTLLVVAGVFLARNLKATKGDKTAVELVGAALLMRWLSGIATYGPVRMLWPAIFPAAVFVDSTVVTQVAYLLVTFAFLRSQLFSLRGLAVDLLLLAAGAVSIVALSALAVEAALFVTQDPVALRVALVLASFIPIAAIVAGAKLGRGFERLVARNIDPRRLLRQRLVERVEGSRDPDSASLVRLVEAALSELSGGRASYLPRGGEAPPAEVDSPHDLVVPVRSATSLHGTLVVDGGLVDRETRVGAHVLADRLALKLDTYALFVELEAARRLATLGAFAAAIAHDIRTPLTSVQMNVQILRKKVRLPPDEMEYFDIALEELKRLDGNIKELLEFAKPAHVETAPLDLSSVIAEARRTTESLLGEVGVSLHVETSADTPIVVGDAARLRNVLENLVTNAANASPRGGKIAIRTRRADDGRAVLEVADDGRGIAPADLPRIFEPFFTTRPDGTGLGLAICDKLVRAQNGEIRVDAKLGAGATFAVLLPAAQKKGSNETGVTKRSNETLPGSAPGSAKSA